MLEKNPKMQETGINGSDDKSNQIPQGSILIYVTDEGRYGKLKILKYGYDLTIKWVTYDKDASVFNRGDQLQVKGTWLYDLDYGVEGEKGRSKADFWWEQVKSNTIRYFVSRNSAGFLLYDVKK